MMFEAIFSWVHRLPSYSHSYFQSSAENGGMTPLANIRKELELNLNSLVTVQHGALRDLIREALAFDNIQATVFYDMVLRRPRVALNFFNNALQRQGRVVPIVDPSGNVLRAFLKNLTTTLQNQGLSFFTTGPPNAIDELSTSFRIYLGRLQRRSVAVPVSLQALVTGERVGQNVADIVEELELMSFFNDAIAGNHAVFRDVSFQSQSAWGLFIRDALAERETPLAHIEAPDDQAMLQLRAEYVRLVAARVVPTLNQLVANFRHQRIEPCRDAERNEALDALIADDLQDSPASIHFPGFQPLGPSRRDASSRSDEDVVETVFWPDVETFISSRSGPRPRWLCFCSAELFIPSLESGDASQHPDKEPLRILNCSHVVGAICMRALAIQNPRCPFCHQPI